jgi:IrrE N-terminal-like domain
MTAYTEEDFERIAQTWRARLYVEDQPKPNMIGVLDELVRQNIISAWVSVPDDLMNGAEGRFDPADRRIFLRESDCRGAAEGNPRSNFTIAHEIGHMVFQVSHSRNRSTEPSVAEKIISGIRRDERRANGFAAAFLAPFHKAEFSFGTTWQQVAERFNLSRQAAQSRLEEFARIYRRKRNFERDLPDVAIDFLEEARARGHNIRSLPSPGPKAAKFRVEPIPPSTVEEACLVCSWPQLEIYGVTKVRCPECKATYDRFQDGDRVLG